MDFGGWAAGIGRDEPDLAAENAAGLVDLFGGELGARFLRRPEQRCRAAERDEQPDLEFIGGGRWADEPRQGAERHAARGGAEKRSPRQSLLPNAHVDVSLVFSSYYQET